MEGRLINRYLDGIYFRVKRAGEWQRVCFSDLDETEATEILKDKNAAWLRDLCWLLALVIKDIGEQLDLRGGVIE